MSPFIIIIQSFGGVLAGIALLIVNLYMLPENTWMYRETAFVGLLIMFPSFVLWVILWGLQILGMSAVWMRLVIWITLGSAVAFIFMWGIDQLLELPAMVSIGGSNV